MNETTYEAFEATSRAEGFDEVLTREWAPELLLDTHQHPFSVKARVARGEAWLTFGGQTLHLQAGDGFELARDEPQAERYGRDGATFWVARRHGPPA